MEFKSLDTGSPCTDAQLDQKAMGDEGSVANTSIL